MLIVSVVSPLGQCNGSLTADLQWRWCFRTWSPVIKTLPLGHRDPFILSKVDNKGSKINTRLIDVSCGNDRRQNLQAVDQLIEMISGWHKLKKWRNADIIHYQSST
ncbi:hypothetical protein AVEN_175438-1 [Araneus ventricosus]|uniref:Uncharacterized protein n=1 Tax=Araneus ventricosus TaxID=182803 RepID=A0A4Y2LUU4_ARAVE|nr:hypothetical protein AVEN_175438-1 [Araneus ventricosus]